MKYSLICLGFLALMLSGCLVQSPKYTTLNQVMSLQIGMPRAEVEKILGIKPYDLKSYSDSSKVLIYIYRVVDRRTIPFNTKPVNGKSTLGKYVQLDINYSPDERVISINTCRECPKDLENITKIDFGKILAFITVTLPVILVYVGLK